MRKVIDGKRFRTVPAIVSAEDLNDKRTCAGCYADGKDIAVCISLQHENGDGYLCVGVVWIRETKQGLTNYITERMTGCQHSSTATT